MQSRRGIWFGLVLAVLLVAGLFLYPLTVRHVVDEPGIGQVVDAFGETLGVGDASPPPPGPSPPDESWTPILLERGHPGLDSVALSTADPDATATNYALAHITRETRRLKSVLTTAVADAQGYGGVTVPYFGTSSPWVERAVISTREETASGAFVYAITFTWATSTGPADDSTEVVEVTQVEEQWLITNITP